MKKHLSLIFAALFAAGGLWFAWWNSRTQPVQRARVAIDAKAGRTSVSASRSAGAKSEGDYRGGSPPSQLNGAQTNKVRTRLAPPDPTRKFREFTPEERVGFARKGHGPGG